MQDKHNCSQIHLQMLFKMDSQHKHISQLLICPDTQIQAWTAFIAPPPFPPSLSFLSLLLLFLNGMKVAMAGIQDHRARDHTDGGGIKVLCELHTVLPFFHARDEEDEEEEEEREPPAAVTSRLITYHVSPAAPRRARRDRSHLSSLRGSQYNLPGGSDIQRRDAQLPKLICQMRTPFSAQSRPCVSLQNVEITDLALIWGRHLGPRRLLRCEMVQAGGHVTSRLNI